MMRLRTVPHERREAATPGSTYWMCPANNSNTSSAPPEIALPTAYTLYYDKYALFFIQFLSFLFVIRLPSSSQPVAHSGLMYSFYCL